MKRESHKCAGYDCQRNPCGKNGCGTHRGSNHGIHCDEWWYTVSNGETAISLCVFSGIYPPSVPEHQQGRDYGGGKPRGANLSLHRKYPRDREELLGSSGECEYIDGGRCYGSDGSSLAADELYKLYGGERFEQSEVFWLALELKLAEWSKNAVDFSKTHEKCIACDGLGIVRKS